MKNSIYRRISALVLAVSMLLPMATNAVTISDEDTQTKKATTNESVSVQLPDVVSVAELTQGTQILQHIDEEVLAANQHIMRLPAEEELSSYAFLNRDGSMTVYYMDKAVKFVDQSGEIVEKNLSLTKTLGGFTTMTNDIGLILPDDPANGINMSYEGYNITLAPMGGVLRSKAQNDGESVVYPNYYGGGMSLKYTPSLDGLKEDIVLSRYSGVNSFTFRLFTDGLRMYQEDGSYYLAKSSNSDVQISLGDVVAFDAKGKFSIGTMTVETVTMGQEYLLTLSVDPTFLTSMNTSYPVYIDPTLTVSDNTHSAGAIEDITLYSGKPNLNADWTYLHCGYYDSTYRVARTLFRLTGLLSDPTYQSLSATDINSVKFYIKEATGSAGIPVYLHANTGNATWTESAATWNNAGLVIGNRYAAASPGVNQVAAYDITNLAKAWKDNEESAQAGFVLVSSNEVSVDKAFYSAEAPNMDNRSYVVVDYNVGTNFENAISITPLHSVPISITVGGERKYFKYIPYSTGFYTIQSADYTGDPKMWLYNCAGEELTIGDDDYTAGDYNFSLTYHFIAGVTYYIAVGQYAERIGSYSFMISYHPTADALDTDFLPLNSNIVADIDMKYQFVCYEITIRETNFYTIKSYTATGDPIVRIYRSDLSLLTSNDGGGGGNNFYVNVYLTEGTKYYIVVAHTGAAIGSISFAAMKPAEIVEYAYNVKNVDSALIMDVPSSSAGANARQNTMHSNPQGHWKIKKETDGTYTIQSQYGNKYYLGVSSTEVGQDNVILSTTDSPATRWHIYETADHKLLFEPISALGKVLYAPNDNTGTEMQLVWASLADSACLWRIGGYNSSWEYKASSRTITLQCVGDLTNNEMWYPLVQSAVALWNNANAGVNIQLTNSTSKYILIVEENKEDMKIGVAYQGGTKGLTTPVNQENLGGIDLGAEIQICQELLKNTTNEERISVIAHEIGHLFGLEDIEEYVNHGEIVDDDDFFLGDNSLMSYGREKTETTGPKIFDIRNVLFLYE